jgi:pSer/pThr/pTyr-binding forkhead associated (FHA) protein
MASITVAADGQEQKYALENATVTLGRGLESDIRLKDIKASRRHCQIVKTPQGYQCLDLSSGNGTYVNGVQIKQQPLNPGDKIQIGATTITFHDGDGARSASQSQAARAASGMTTKAAAASKTATAQLPAAAPTRKITARVDAVRPTTQAVSKAATQPMAKATQSVKTGTQGIPKTGTQSVRPATGAMKKTTGRAPTARATATQKFHADAKRKKSNPVAILIGIIGAIFLVVVGFILFSSSGDQDAILQHDIQKLLNRAVELENANQLDPAIAEYQKMLTLVGGSDKWKTRAAEWRTRIKELETAKGDLASAQGKFQQFKDRFAKLNDTEAEPFEKELKDFKAQVGGSQLPFLPELEDLILKVGKMIDTKRATDRRSDFQAKRQEINDKFKLGNRKEVPWSDAIRAWKEYIDSKVTDDNKNKAENEIRQINQRAREELDSIRKRAEKMVEENNKTGALDELKKHRGRFELTESAGQLQKLVETYDK